MLRKYDANVTYPLLVYITKTFVASYCSVYLLRFVFLNCNPPKNHNHKKRVV